MDPMDPIPRKAEDPTGDTQAPFQRHGAAAPARRHAAATARRVPGDAWRFRSGWRRGFFWGENMGISWWFHGDFMVISWWFHGILNIFEYYNPMVDDHLHNIFSWDIDFMNIIGRDIPSCVQDHPKIPWLMVICPMKMAVGGIPCCQTGDRPM